VNEEYELVDGRWYVGGGVNRSLWSRLGRWVSHRPVVMVGMLGFVCGVALWALFELI
jgi:hypothetical protein